LKGIFDVKLDLKT